MSLATLTSLPPLLPVLPLLSPSSAPQRLAPLPPLPALPSLPLFVTFGASTALTASTATAYLAASATLAAFVALITYAILASSVTSTAPAVCGATSLHRISFLCRDCRLRRFWCLCCPYCLSRHATVCRHMPAMAVDGPRLSNAGERGNQNQIRRINIIP